MGTTRKLTGLPPDALMRLAAVLADALSLLIFAARPECDASAYFSRDPHVEALRALSLEWSDVDGGVGILLDAFDEIERLALALLYPTQPKHPDIHLAWPVDHLSDQPTATSDVGDMLTGIVSRARSLREDFTSRLSADEASGAHIATHAERLDPPHGILRLLSSLAAWGGMFTRFGLRPERRRVVAGRADEDGGDSEESGAHTRASKFTRV